MRKQGQNCVFVQESGRTLDGTDLLPTKVRSWYYPRRRRRSTIYGVAKRFDCPPYGAVITKPNFGGARVRGGGAVTMLLALLTFKNREFIEFHMKQPGAGAAKAIFGLARQRFNEKNWHSKEVNRRFCNSC